MSNIDHLNQETNNRLTSQLHDLNLGNFQPGSNQVGGLQGHTPSSQAPREPCSACNDVSGRHYTLYPGQYAEISQPGMTRPLHPFISGTETRAIQSSSATSPRYACSQALTSPFITVPIEQPLTCSSGVDARLRGYIRSVTPSPADEANFQGLRRRGLLWNRYTGVEDCWREE